MKKSKNIHKRIYICHTFYHAYISCLKELNRNREEWGEADLMLSSMSNDFGNLKERAEKSGLFRQVIPFDEKEAEFFPELAGYKKDRGNLLLNMLQRIIFTKKLGKRLAPYVPVNLREYCDIYVFCDSDPIGYYLSTHRIYYHAVEDGLDCIRYYDTARYDNRGHFRLKAWMAARNLIFIQNGYSKYCIDMEVNDTSSLQYPCPKYVEKPRKELVDGLTDEAKRLLTEIFIENWEALTGSLKDRGQSSAQNGAKNDMQDVMKDDMQSDVKNAMKNDGQDTHRILILTEPLCDLETRERIFRDIIGEYQWIEGKKAQVILKPHPRDVLDYSTLFSEYTVLDGKFPMEILNFVEGLVFDKVISVFTVPDAILFAKEKVYLGEDFMDKYEAPEIHRQNELI